VRALLLGVHAALMRMLLTCERWAQVLHDPFSKAAMLESCPTVHLHTDFQD
jgi:hypothetical protein